ncbi:MAG: NADPH:quinone reductase-like Zn-dependent oxidoreductase, partial [Pseudohongiellaceae bacterium]
WMAGAPIHWPSVQREHVRKKLLLPTYPFQRERFWLLPRQHTEVIGLGGELLHPLLGVSVDVATLNAGQRVFANTLSAETPAWLSDHSVYESTVTPAAAYAEWALAAARELGQPGSHTIERLEVLAALVPGEAGAAVQLVATADDDGMDFKLYARPIESSDDGSGSSAPWVVHASGRVIAESEPVPEAVDPEAMVARCTDVQNVAEYYANYSEIGLDYGPRFQAITELSRGDDEAWVRLVLPEGSPAAREFVLHPVLLDACFQSCRTVALLRDLTDIYLPLGIDALRIHGNHDAASAVAGWWVHVRLGSVSDDGRALVMNISIYDSTGQPLATVDSLRLIVASRSALMAATDPLKTLAHQVSWEARERQTIADGFSTGQWLVLADAAGFGNDLAAEIELQGGQALVVRQSELKNDDSAAWSAIFHELNDPHRPCQGVVHCWAMDGETPEAADPARHEALSGSLLALVQNLAHAPARVSPRMYVVTRGAVPASGLPETLDLPASAQWALAGSLALEHSEWLVTRVDLDPLGGNAEASNLCVEMFANDSELQVAWRGGERRVARLIRRPAVLVNDGLQPPRGASSWRLGLSAFGVIDNLTCLPQERRAPRPGEVEIAVSHGALNFKDVMFSLGLLQDYTGITDAKQQPLGLECAGTVVAVGEGVSEASVGQRVMASAAGCLASHITVPQTGVAVVPEGVDAPTAAAVQTVFLTSLYGLQRCAQLKAGQRVLIHAAAGGVGQAAISVARRAGAEIFATASPGKWPLLRRQGVTHVFSSRDTEFAANIRMITDGAGVDVVLNSLAGEVIPASLEVLAEGGHFVDIGKLDTWSPERMSTARPDVRYHTFDMAEILAADPGLLRELLDELCAGLADGSLTAPPLRVFPLADGIAATRLLASSRTVGKLVLAFPAAATAVSAAGSWLITGGSGALGRNVAHWLVEQGVDQITLCARSAPSETAAADIAALREAGATIDIVPLDMSDAAAVKALVATMAAANPPLRGVVHAAGILDDGMLVNQTWERFKRVMAPKVAGSWALHEATKHLPLEHFVMFSSMVSLVGAQGQGPYAAANGFMDGLAEHRRALGLAALSINWGPWAGDGMASGSAAINKARFAEAGIGSIGPEQGTAALGRLLGDGGAAVRRPAQVGILPVTWSRFLARFPNNMVPPFFSTLVRSGPAVTQEA